MKAHKTLIPKGPHHPEALPIPLDGSRSDLPPVLLAAPLKKRASRVLDHAASRNRLTLVLGLMCVIGLGFAIPMILDCLLVIAELLTALSDSGKVLWPVILYAAVLSAVTIFFTLPLTAALFRMAVLMTEAHERDGLDGQRATVGLGELLYPFTSARAYGRTLYVALRGIGLFLLAILPSILLIVASVYLIPMVGDISLPLVEFFLWLIVITAACLALTGLSRLTARGTGLGYFVFVNDEVPLKDLRRDFEQTPHRSASLPLWMLCTYLGWILLSIIAVFIPFVIHTLPHMLLSWASYGRYLSHPTEPADAQEACPLTSEPRCSDDHHVVEEVSP